MAGILLALILPNTLKAIDRANRTAEESNVKTLQTAVFMCYTQTKDWKVCNTEQQLFDGHYIEKHIVSPYGEDYVFRTRDDVSGNEGIGVIVYSALDPAAKD